MKLSLKVSGNIGGDEVDKLNRIPETIKNKQMKKFICILHCCFALLLITSTGCKKMDDYNTPVSNDKTKPGPVTNVQITPTNGGAEITYDLPAKSDNILYVMAEYKINDTRSRQTKSSYYDNKIMVQGFAEANEYEVILTAVSRAEVKSEPVSVKVTPLEPIYKQVRSSLSTIEDFGGIQISGSNPTRATIGVVVLTRDNNNLWSVAGQQFNTMPDIKFSVRGYDSLSRDFAVVTEDEWGNVSDTLFQTLKPLYEYQLDKTKFQQFVLPTDAASDYGWNMPFIWDGNSQNDIGFHTAVGSGMPQHFTFDLGTLSQLSRYKIWLRASTWTFGHGNPKHWRIWGAANPNPDGSFDASWTLLGEFESYPKPSGLAAGFTAEDEAFSRAGFEYTFALGLPKVRYIRFETLQTWTNTDFMHFYEISFWGN